MKRILAVMALLATVGAPALAAYPERPVRIIIGFPPGGAIDTIARLMGPPLAERLGQPVVIENKPGAGGVVATQGVARAEADGYTVLMGTMGNLSITPVLTKDLSYDMEKDFAPVTVVASSGFVLYVNPALPARTVGELIAYAKANPGKVNFSSSGNGGLPHMAGELFNAATGLKLTHVPYKGSTPAINDVIAGQVQMTFEATAIGLPFVEAGRLRALATTGDRRLAVFPDAPAVAETLPGFSVTNWFGMVVPARTPQDRIDRLQKEIAVVLARPEIKERLDALGVAVVASPPEAAGRFMREERSRWAKVIRDANITAN
ncbi:tripartite tricarboxylate transporter substrate binding protein [Pigmentiphaga sp.]|uniref:Bug family tripartite tricarboxylate transporter substrate binding protein n=1 Tax=Pigmentiphaga sp. TaxID=1977564 RepID=UPI00128B4EB7|nr:tripartite tricarboxylate transporter substrate binding protein [Pigmentiphaga sp.]MPS27401.1 tripartite tricarboxylate transporter substrate binding protein [Alcaligenaceae bacterium SAGV5]MPS30418.1 tripartite tricarboxylate transporter substrate binding protein [Alcaligenaceae bacterium SAGV5]MPS52020.1 tripartite tricarboxylate transporter substrate binding protein [Alcaligenaceae bacterium SAGV3]MPT60587.1 tripartite tricarboxylate transporter substrate binding protein [Alcaligenaceae b